MRILALDTAMEACSAALLIDGRILTRYSEPGRGHAELILPMVHELLAAGGAGLQSLDCIAVGRGPGAFTGIRIAMAVAQGLAYGAQLPVIAISDLAALAQRAADKHGVPAVLACTDARMNEVYWGGFNCPSGGLVECFIEECVSPPAAVGVDWSGPWVAAGSGWAAYPHMAIAPVVDAALLPRAEEIARLAVRDLAAGRALPPEQIQPVYLRDKVAHVTKSRT